ncbi:MAG: PP2C family protein-serine/threonine phosphatase [Pirellulales bacterium]
MAKPIPSYLRIHTEAAPEVVRPEVESLKSLPDICRAFEDATGWSLHYAPGEPPEHELDLLWSAPVNPGVGVPPGHFRIDLGSLPLGVSEPPVELPKAGELASAIAVLVGELLRTRHLLWQRDAELAAGVPLTARPDDAQHLAASLEAVLKGGAEAVGCHAAALYLLDAGTTELKLRSSWGLPADRLTAPARPLREATADLEALSGNAVVLEDTRQFRHWNVPEDFASAVCIPVSSSAMPLGTLWVFSREMRDFDDRQTNIIEVVAGRLAADMEREMLLGEALEGAELKRQVAVAERLQESQLPGQPPELEGWEVAGWTHQAHGVGGALHDWFSLPDGSLAVAVGQAMEGGLDAAMAASALRAAIHAHGEHAGQPRPLIEHVNRSLRTSSVGDLFADLFYGVIEPRDAVLRYASAGQVGALLLRPGGSESLVDSTLPLGVDAGAEYEPRSRELMPGEVLVVYSDGVRGAFDDRGRPQADAALAQTLLGHLHEPAERLLRMLVERLQAPEPCVEKRSEADRSVLVVKRLPRTV